MDYLQPGSPAFSHKRAERDLVMRAWGGVLADRGCVLDIGGGIGRFAMPCLDAGATVHLVDADAEALACAQRHAVGRPGRLQTWVADAAQLPAALPRADAAILSELLCYVADPAAVLEGLRPRLLPGAPLCFSVEARWGWAMAVDAPPGQLGALFGDGVVHVPGDRFVRTYEEADVRALFAGWTLERLVPPTSSSGGRCSRWRVSSTRQSCSVGRSGPPPTRCSGASTGPGPAWRGPDALAGAYSASSSARP
jgi:SAM-dependent methyltransferase